VLERSRPLGPFTLFLFPPALFPHRLHDFTARTLIGARMTRPTSLFFLSPLQKPLWRLCIQDGGSRLKTSSPHHVIARRRIPRLPSFFSLPRFFPELTARPFFPITCGCCSIGLRQTGIAVAENRCNDSTIDRFPKLSPAFMIKGTPPHTTFVSLL